MMVIVNWVSKKQEGIIKGQFLSTTHKKGFNYINERNYLVAHNEHHFIYLTAPTGLQNPFYLINILNWDSH